MVPFTYIREYLKKKFLLVTFLTFFDGPFWPYFESVNGYDFNENGFETP